MAARHLVLVAVTALVCAVGTGSFAVAAPAPIRLVSVSALGPAEDGVRIDRVMYTNRGVTLEALAALPTGPGPHPIVVLLHSGWALPQPYVTHYPLGGIASAVAQLARRYPTALVVAPAYRGYMQSAGHPSLIDASASDARAAVRIAARVLHGSGRDVYLVGYGVGGGVALALAGELRGVRAVVAVGPFVGYDLEWHWDAWDGKTGRDPAYGKVRAIAQEEEICITFEGEPDQVPRAYAAQSPDAHLAPITAPVLLLQGTADTAVPWQATREVANRLARAGKRVRFVLYPGGGSSLATAPFEARATAQILAWLDRAGLRKG